MKIFEIITPEMVSFATVVLAMFTLFLLLMVLITIASLSRVKRRLLGMGEKLLELERKHTSLQQNSQMMSTHTASLSEAADKIESLEPRLKSLDNQIAGLAQTADKLTSIDQRLDGIDQRIAQSQDQLTGHESKLNEHDTIIGQTGQLMGKNATVFSQAIQRIRTLEQEFQGLKVFQRTFEQIRHRILNALDAMPTETTERPQNMPTPEQKVFKEETDTPSGEKPTDLEDYYKSRTHRYP
jgi:chromosome segregation ATPase